MALPVPALAAGPDLPDLPGPPTFPVCVTEPCDAVVCDDARDEVAGTVRYGFTSDCRVIVEDDVMCEASRYDTIGAGPAEVRLERCEPGIGP